MDGHITSNPVVLVNLPRNLQKTKRSLPSDDEIKLVKNSTDCTFGLFAFFLMYTGCRKCEALALQYGDIDLKNKKIRISKAVYFVGNQPQIKQSGFLASLLCQYCVNLYRKTGGFRQFQPYLKIGDYSYNIFQ